MQHVLGFVPLAHLAGDVARTSRLWRSLALDPALWLPHWRRLHFARPNVELPENDARRGVQPPPEGAWRDERGSESDPWLVDASRSLQQAFDDDYPIDWRREYLRRKTLRVLVVTYHTSHNNNYDMDTIRQLKKFGIHADICHLMCNHDSKVVNPAAEFYSYVDYDDNLFMKYDTIIYFAAMSGSDAMKKSLGDGLQAFLKSGGGVIFCIYTHMKSYQLQGKWTESFYPIKPANRLYSSGAGDAHQKREKSRHPIMTGVRNSQIDTTRHGSRCLGQVDPLAQVVGEYEDGVPLVVVLDGEANRTKARQEEEKARREEAAAAEQEQGSDSSQAESDDNSGGGGDDMCEPQPAKPDQEAKEEWGKTVFLNFFPVSKDDPCTGGWYDWNSDIPLLLRNAVLFAARKGAPAAPAPPDPSFPH